MPVSAPQRGHDAARPIFGAGRCALSHAVAHVVQASGAPAEVALGVGIYYVGVILAGTRDPRSPRHRRASAC